MMKNLNTDLRKIIRNPNSLQYQCLVYIILYINFQTFFPGRDMICYRSEVTIRAQFSSRLSAWHFTQPPPALGDFPSGPRCAWHHLPSNLLSWGIRLLQAFHVINSIAVGSSSEPSRLPCSLILGSLLTRIASPRECAVRVCPPPPESKAPLPSSCLTFRSIQRG